jgi:hypothetical protein
MIRLIRLPRIIKIFSVKTFKKNLNLCITGNTRTARIVSRITVRKTYSIIRLVLLAVVTSYFITALFYIFVKYQCLFVQCENNFFTNFKYDTEGMEDNYKMLNTFYFSMTTLAKIGYGDRFPVSTAEKVLMVVIMFSGMIFFSYVLEQFIYII